MESESERGDTDGLTGGGDTDILTDGGNTDGVTVGDYDDNPELTEIYEASTITTATGCKIKVLV